MDGKDLHFVPGENFVEKIRYYLKHDDERHQIALRGMQTVKRDYTVQKRAKQLITYLESICK
jgi:spore maturation protein CgeB